MGSKNPAPLLSGWVRFGRPSPLWLIVPPRQGGGAQDAAPGEVQPGPFLSFPTHEGLVHLARPLGSWPALTEGAAGVGGPSRVIPRTPGWRSAQSPCVCPGPRPGVSGEMRWAGAQVLQRTRGGRGRREVPATRRAPVSVVVRCGGGRTVRSPGAVRVRSRTTTARPAPGRWPRSPGWRRRRPPATV